MPSPNAVQRLAPALAVTSLLAGCAHPVAEPYLAPAPSKATARLLVRGTIDSGDTYSLFVFRDAQACSGGQLAGTGTSSTDPQATTLLAGVLQTVELHVVKANRAYCSMDWSFTPVAGRSYLVRARSEPDGCASLVYDATRPEAMQVEPSLRRRDAGRVACVPISMSRPVAKAAASGKASSGGVSLEDLQGLIGK